MKEEDKVRVMSESDDRVGESGRFKWGREA